MNRARYFIASFVAPVVALLLPSLLALAQLFAETEILPDGSSDDAGMRGAGLFLVIGLPICYLVGCLYYAGVGHILARLRRLTLKTTVYLAVAAPWLLVAVATVGLFLNNRSIAPGLIILGIIGALMSLFATLGALAWWFIAIGKAPSNPLLQRTAALPVERQR